MADIVSTEVRSRMMSGIRDRNTRPELLVRQMLHAAGFRFRLHKAGLPGKPDIVLPRWRAVVQVHGCFWHGHDCHLYRLPSTRPEFWKAKIAANQARDATVAAQLDESGWRQLTIWECAVRGRSRLPPADVGDLIAAWIRSDARAGTIRGTS